MHVADLPPELPLIEFFDGPAKGQYLALRRAPTFLRVVFNPAANAVRRWDALDQLEDQPHPSETIYVYRTIEDPRRIHIKATRYTATGWYWMARYAFLNPQPDDMTARMTLPWRIWCLAQVGRGPVVIQGTEAGILNSENR